MRSTPIPPGDLTAVQRPLYREMKSVIESNFADINAVRDDGALTGPWAPWLQWPRYGGPIWELAKALTLSPTLPPELREVAILVTGTRFGAAYEIHAHVLAAGRQGLPDHRIASIVAGQRPADLTADEGIVYDLTAALVEGGGLPESTYRQALDRFGETATAELIYLVGLYCLVSVTLNGFDVAPD